ncbi:helix-turn-helix domain-containing protein [Nonomuraea sp. NPDC052129]|uniref:TetR/AcrR family transcriptional regulator n=1 Tax=Nonomuraea sp. NPDC052129 TaxID=3154651 RepID=UPI00342FDBAF
MSTDQPHEETVKTRHERRRIQTRERIADTALTLFSERGYDAVTIAEIAEAADVAKQTVVNHFPAKEDLLLAWHRPVEADVIDLIDQLPLSTPLPEFLKEELPRMFAKLPEAPKAPQGGGERAAAGPQGGGRAAVDPQGGGGRAGGDPRLARVGAIIMKSPSIQDALRRRGSRYQEDLAAILSDRVPARLGPVAARALAAFILTTVTAMVEEAMRLRAGGQPAEQIAAALTETAGRALDILDTGLGGPEKPSE